MRSILAFALALPLLGQSLVIRNATVIDATGAPPRPKTSVVITGQKITSVGGKSASKRVLDATGKFVIPGLWDMHVHLWESDPMLGLYIANGVTGIRDMGSDLKRTLALRREINLGRRTGPRIFTSGPVIGPVLKNPGKLPVIQVQTPAEAQSAVDRIDDSGADFVKIISGLSRDIYMAVAYRARLLRIPFEGHLPESVTFAEAVESRQKSLEHLFGIPFMLSTEEQDIRRERTAAIAAKDREALKKLSARIYSTWSEEKGREMFQQATRYGTWQCPTLTLRERMALMNAEQLANDSRAKYIPKKVLSTWEDPRGDLKGVTPEQLAEAKDDYQKCLQMTQWMKRSGADLLAGTDTGDPYVLPGFALHDELKLLTDAGLTPMEALQSATRNPARFFKQEATLGTVEKGKIADLVILDGDPLKDIRNTSRIHAVVVRGRLYTRKDLDRLLAVQ